MKSSSVLDDYISTFENSIMHSNYKGNKHSNYEKPFNSSFSQIMDDNKFIKGKKFTIDEIPTKESTFQMSPMRSKQDDLENSTGIKVLNFKEFYENSKLNINSDPSSSKSKSSLQQRSRSTLDRDSYPLQNKLGNLIKPTNLINYNINEYLPSQSIMSLNKSVISNSLLSINNPSLQQSQSQYFQAQATGAKNIFQNNLSYLQQQQQQFNHQSPPSTSYQHQSQYPQQQQHYQQCSCGGGNGIFGQGSTSTLLNNRQSNSQANILQTQRSSCSCQYSNSGSQYTSPSIRSSSSSYYNRNQYMNNRHSHQNSYGGGGVGNGNLNPKHQQQQQQQPLQQIMNQGNVPHLNMQGRQQQSQPFINSAYQQQQFDKRGGSASTSNIFTSNENTPFKQQHHQQQQQLNFYNLGGQVYSQQQIENNQSPISNTVKMMPQKHSQGINSQPMFEDRSISFLKSSNKKEKTLGGYNTDDLLRDSESEVDLNQVSNILQEVQMNFQEGFQNYLKITSNNQNESQQARAQREQLAMQILIMNQQQPSGNSDAINLSQIKTIKQSQIQDKGPQLTLDSLQMSNINQSSQIQTPLSNFDTNTSQNMMDFNNQQTYKGSRNLLMQPTSIPSQQSQLSYIQMLSQQYQSPCFNSFEDSSLNLFQQPSNPQQQQQQLQTLQSLMQNQQQQQQQQLFKNPAQNDQQTMKLSNNYNSVPQNSNNNNQNNQQQDQKNSQKQKKKDKSKRKKSVNTKLLKKSYNEEEYSHRKGIKTTNYANNTTGDDIEDGNLTDKENSTVVSGECSTQKHSSNRNTATFEEVNSNNQSMIKVLKEISIQTQSQNYQEALNQSNNSSFLDKSQHSQVQIEKQKSDASCQYEMIPQTNNFKKAQQLPPQQKRTQNNKVNYPINHAIKSVGCSGPSSKNSTINPNQNHFQSHNHVQELDDYYLQLDDESIQHQTIAGGNSCGTTSNSSKLQMNNLNILNPSNHFSQPNILSPYGPHHQGFNNYDHFKSQCSEVIIRGSSETDISNKIAMFKNMKATIENQNHPQSQHFQSQSNTNHHQNSHQISGSQSIVNIGPHSRSQFTSIETHNYSPSKGVNMIYVNSVNGGQNDDNKKTISCVNEYLIDSSSYDPNERFSNDQLLAGDTFMKSKQHLLQTQQTDTDNINHEVEDHFNKRASLDFKDYQDSQEYKSIETDPVNQEHLKYQNTQGSQQQQTDEEFNYTVRLTELQNMNQDLDKQTTPQLYSQRPPIHHSPYQQQQQPYHQLIPQNSYSNPYLNGTGSTAGFPQLYGYQFSQQTGRKSTINSSFHSQNIKNSNSQTSLKSNQTTYTNQNNQLYQQISSQNIKKLSFMEKIILIQRQVRDFLERKRQINNLNEEDDNRENSGEISQHMQGFFGDSTIAKPVEDSLSNISAQLLNSLKQSLGSHVKNIKPGDQSYQKNILESLNLTTGNTFIKDTRQFHQGQLMKERTQNLGNSSNLVLYSGSTNDNRLNPFQGNAHVRNSDQLFLGGNQESQQSYGKPPLYDYEQHNKGDGQQSPNNNSLLNMTEESNSGIFKLTPLASQNVTQKTHNIQYNQTSNMNERTTESNNLNYSCSEMDSEWCNNIQRDCATAVSPMSINTTSSKIKNNFNGGRMGQRIGGLGQINGNINNNILFQRSGSVQSEQIHHNFNHSGQHQAKYTQKIKIEEYVQSPLSINQIPSTKSAAAANSILTKQEQMLNILKSQDYGTKGSTVQAHQERHIKQENVDDSRDQQEWKLLKPLRQNDLNNILIALLSQKEVSNSSDQE